MLAYLVIREGSKWTDVFRLVPGQAVTIGRAPTNQIVIKDERCSRCHAEVFLSEDQWTLRDLDSRNGTVVGGKRVRGDYVLQPATSSASATRNWRSFTICPRRFPNEQSRRCGTADVVDDETRQSADVDRRLERAVDARADHDHASPRSNQVSRAARSSTRRHSPKLGRAAASLCRLAFELAKAPDVISLADLALAGLFEGTQVDAGAVLLLPRDYEGEPIAGDLEVVASRTDSTLPYHRVSTFLAATVLREGEAVLARNVMGDSTLGSRDSKGEIHATSVICAPIRRGKTRAGADASVFDQRRTRARPDDLEFTLAVADTVAVALENLSRRQELAENLNQIRDENVQLRERLGVQSEIVGSSIADGQRRAGNRPGRAQPGHGADPRRKRRRQGTRRPGRALLQPAQQRAVRLPQLRRPVAQPAGQRTVRPRARARSPAPRSARSASSKQPHKGTLMLDEIGEMSPAIQAKFLRVLEGHPFERVGGTETDQGRRPRDRRHESRPGTRRGRGHASAATCTSACACWRSSCRRLRKRPEDIPELAQYFLQQVQRRDRPQAPRLHAAGDGADAQVSLAGQRPRVEERRRAGRRARPRRVHRRRRPDALAALHRRRHGRPARCRTAAVPARPRWPTWNGSTSWPRSRPPTGTRARRPRSSASNARRSTAKSAATSWSKNAAKPRHSCTRWARAARGFNSRSTAHVPVHCTTPRLDVLSAHSRDLSDASFHREYDHGNIARRRSLGEPGAETMATAWTKSGPICPAWNSWPWPTTIRRAWRRPPKSSKSTRPFPTTGRCSTR